MAEVVTVQCRACGATLTRPLSRRPVTELREEAIGDPSLPPGVAVVDPKPLTSVIESPDGRVTPVEYAPAGAVVCRPDDISEGAVVASGGVGGCCGMDGLGGWPMPRPLPR